MDEADRVTVAQLPATVDDFLATTLHFRVFTLNRSKIQIRRTGAGRHRRSSTPAQTDQHGRTAQHDQLGTDSDLALLDVIFANVAHTASQHDRLVVTADFVAMRCGDRLLEGTEVTGQCRTAELVVERRATQRAFNHDIQRGHDALGLAVRLLPGLHEPRNLQVGNGETGETRLRLGAATGCTFVTNLATGTGRCARERSDCGRVVVCFDLHQNVHRFLHCAVLAGFRIREEATGDIADDHRGVVLISRQNAFAVHLIGVLDHAEQAFFLALAVDIPTGVENLVAAVLGVGLGKHHQFDVVRVATQPVEAGDQIVDFVFGQGQTQFNVGLFQRSATATQDINRRQRLGLGMAEQTGSLFVVAQDQLSHAVVQAVGDGLSVGLAELAFYIEGDPAFDALNLRQTAVASDVAGLARPWRNGAKPWQHQKQTATRLLNRHAWAVFQETVENLLFFAGQSVSDVGEVSEFSVQATDS